MYIDWIAPLRLAFELGMFVLGGLLLLMIVAIATVLAYGIIRSVYMSITRKKSADPGEKQIRKIFPVR